MLMPKNQYEIIVQALKKTNLRSYLRSTIYKLCDIEQTPSTHIAAVFISQNVETT